MLFLFSRWPFRVSDPEGKSTLGASESGDAPGLSAGTSDFPSGREVRTGLLAYRKIGKVTEATSKFWLCRSGNIIIFGFFLFCFFVFFFACTFVDVFVVRYARVWCWEFPRAYIKLRFICSCIMHYGGCCMLHAPDRG